MGQEDLFLGAQSSQLLSLHGLGELEYRSSWLSRDESRQYFYALEKQISWQQPTIKIYGMDRKIPRLQAWFGEEGAVMTYSKTRFLPQPWHPLLVDLKARIERLSGRQFNSVLANLYRSGEDSVGWHADDEAELGENPVIASLSLGGPRVFRLRPKPTSVPARGLKGVAQPLSSGDLIIMKGETQRHWHHAILKERHANEPRINLTFRRVVC